MTKTAADTASEVEIFRRQARTTHQVVRLCVDGVTHEESLIQPRPGGNCMNWVMGHLVWAYQGALRTLGKEPVLEEGALKRYARRSPPLQNPREALKFEDLVTAWDKSSEGVDAGLAGLTSEALDRQAPFSPEDDPSETVRSLLTSMLFHQAYHAGQTAVLRRITGKEGAIR
jgi:uncharacterized damage-inducible protein DinB